MKNFLNNLTQRQKTSVKIIAATLLVVLALLAVLYLPKAFAGSDTAKKETTTQQTTSSGKDKESSKKDDQKDKGSDKKEDAEKKDTAETKPAEASTNNSNTTSSNTSTTSNNNAAPATNTASNNNTAPAPVEQPKTPIYQTIHHEEVGHWETQVISEAWDEPIYQRGIIGNQTGRIYNSLAEFDNQREDGSYHVGDVQVGTTHHDAVTQQVWVVDQAAWDETVIVGYR